MDSMVEVEGINLRSLIALVDRSCYIRYLANNLDRRKTELNYLEEQMKKREKEVAAMSSFF